MFPGEGPVRSQGKPSVLESDLGQMLALGTPSLTLNSSSLFHGAVIPVPSSFQDAPSGSVQTGGTDCFRSLGALGGGLRIWEWMSRGPGLRCAAFFVLDFPRELQAGAHCRWRFREELRQGLGNQEKKTVSGWIETKHVVWVLRHIKTGSPWWGGGGRAIASAKATAVQCPISGGCCSLCGNSPAFKPSSWKRDSSCDMLAPGLSHT